MTDKPTAATLTSRQVHKGRVFKTTQDRVKLPNGRETTLDVIRHPPSVILIPILDGEKIILVRQYRYAIDKWIWELPAGNVEPGETLDAAARRECVEETGQIPSTIKRVGTFFPIPGYCNEKMLFYLVTRLRPTESLKLDRDEILTPHVFSLKKAKNMVSNGTIIDMKTALGLTLV
tara:strand:+ start:177 stop:704 length:528 start_codon:yes stop_codon:yes gene_type:complete